MNTDEGMNRRDFLRITGATAAVTGASGTAAAQSGGGNNSSSGSTGGNNSSSGGAGGNNSSSGGSSSGGGGGASGPIDYGGALEGANGWGGAGSTKDMTGKKEVTIKVGPKSDNRAFKPAGVHVDPGTKIIWKWGSTGHNVQAENGDFKSEIKGSGTFEHTVEKEGIIPYFCQPHKGQGMVAALAVGKVPRKEPSTPAPPAVSQGSKTLGVATFTAMVSTLGLAYFFLRYGGDYEQ